MHIRFKKLHPKAQAPYRGSACAAGYDLVAISKTWDAEHSCWVFGTGLALEIPEGYVGLLFPRSSIFKTCHLLANCVGVIDADFRGEVKVFFRQVSDSQTTYAPFERIAQLLIVPLPYVDYVEVEELMPSLRGTQGYGSTGQKSCLNHNDSIEI